MKEKVLFYRLEENVQKAIQTILQQLDVETKEIFEEDAIQQMGYLIDLPGYQKKEGKCETKLTEPFLFFAHFSMEQLDIVLEVFKNAKIPYIPYKAMLTNDNVVYTFEQLYINVENEYLQITNRKKSN